jgi:carboxyl-terminal processing protease
MPDIKTVDEKYSNILISLISKNHIFNYATKYYLAHSQLPVPANFNLTDAEFAEFVNYLKDKDYTYKTRSEAELEHLKQNSEEEKYFNDIKPEYEALINKMASNKKDDLTKHKDQIKRYLEEEITSRYYFQKGRIEFSLKNDDDLKEGIRLLNDQNKIKILLTMIEKPTKPFNTKKKF